MLAILLMAFSAAIFLALGSLHLVYTFVGSKLTPRDSALTSRMREVSPVISRETDMWRCWIGFNASHSLGAMLFGLVYGYLAVVHSALLFASPFLLVVGFLMVSAFLALAKACWFRIPLFGIALSLACYVGGVIAAWI